MQRRRFLKLTALAGVGAALRLPFEWVPALGASSVTSLNGVSYRGDRRGRIFASTNGGATWRLHASFGSSYAVTRLAVDRTGGVRATLAYKRRTFALVLSPDQSRWLTN